MPVIATVNALNKLGILEEKSGRKTDNEGDDRTNWAFPVEAALHKVLYLDRVEQKGF